MQTQIEELRAQLNRQHQQTQLNGPAPPQQAPIFGNHYAGAQPQQQDPARTLPPLMNGVGAAAPPLGPMQGVQYSDERR